jgi:hypothetical protein
MLEDEISGLGDEIDLEEEVNNRNKTDHSNNKSKPKKKSIWDTPVEEYTLDKSNFIENKSFMVVLDDDIDEHSLSNLIKIAKFLNEHKYEFRFDGDTERNTLLYKNVYNIMTRRKSFLAWKNIDTSVAKNEIESTEPSKAAWGIAASYHNKFNEPEFYTDPKKRTSRVFHARTMEMMFSSRMDLPVKLLIVYSKDGNEKYSDITEFSKNSKPSLAIKVANGYDIPVFNLNTPDVLSRLSQLVKG